MSRAVVPIGNLSRRLPEAGRIRTGVKSGKAMKAIPHFRFTSHDEQALQQIAAMYGGDVKSWSDPKAAAGQFEVITEAPEIRVVLPPDPLGGSPVYELWGGGGCERRCDGLNSTILQQGEDGLEPVDVPCICSAKGAMDCKVVTRLSVILPEVRFAGVWRLDTKSWNAAQELPGMVDMVQQMQSSGLAYATLALKHRRSVQGGKTQRFIVPMLGIPNSIEELAAGHARLGALSEGGQSGRRELEAGSPGESLDVDTDAEAEVKPAGLPGPAPSDSSGVDDEIVDAEIVDGPGGGSSPSPSGPSAHTSGSDCSLCGEPLAGAKSVKGHAGESRFVHRACREQANPEPMSEAQSKRIFAELRKQKIVGSQRHEWATAVLGREVTSFKELTSGDAARLIDVFERDGAA